MCVFEAALNRRKLGVYVVDSQTRVLQVNAHGAELRSRYNLMAENGRLILPLAHDTERLHGFVREVATLGEAEVERSLIARAGQRLLYVQTYHQADELAAVLVRDALDFDDTDRARLQNAYLLTPREVDLCLDLTRGSSLAAFSQAHSIARETSKSHLRNVFRKTGCNTQSQLVVTIMNILR